MSLSFPVIASSLRQTREKVVIPKREQERKKVALHSVKSVMVVEETTMRRLEEPLYEDGQDTMRQISSAIQKDIQKDIQVFLNSFLSRDQWKSCNNNKRRQNTTRMRDIVHQSISRVSFVIEDGLSRNRWTGGSCRKRCVTFHATGCNQRLQSKAAMTVEGSFQQQISS